MTFPIVGSIKRLGAPAELPFIFTVTVGSAESFTLPTVSSGTYDCIIDWGDSTSNALTVWNAAGRSHTYTTGGTYEIKITGTFNGWAVNNYGDRLKITEIKQWGVLLVGTGIDAFFGCSNMIITATDTPDLSAVTNAQLFFANCSSIVNIPNLNLWDVSSIKSFLQFFVNCTSFEGAGINEWDMSQATSLQLMFTNCQSFNTNINDWNVSSVQNMQGLFRQCSTFNQPLNNWNTASLSSLGGNINTGIFRSATSFNQDLSNWDVSGVSDFGFAFALATNFNGDISGWDMSNALRLDQMFVSCFNFNSDISSWNLSSASFVDLMFLNCSSFNIDISGWNTSNISNMLRMFEGATSFNQNLSSWNVTSLSGASNNSADRILNNTALSTANYDALLIGWAAQSVNSGCYLGVGSTQYTAGGAAEAARDILINTYGWTITDGGPA